VGTLSRRLVGGRNTTATTRAISSAHGATSRAT
jgi:hypothetical protein